MESLRRICFRTALGRLATLGFAFATWAFVVHAAIHHHGGGTAATAERTLSGDHSHAPVPSGPCLDCVAHHDQAHVAEAAASTGSYGVAVATATPSRDRVPRVASRPPSGSRAPPTLLAV